MSNTQPAGYAINLVTTDKGLTITFPNGTPKQQYDAEVLRLLLEFVRNIQVGCGGKSFDFEDDSTSYHGSKGPYRSEIPFRYGHISDEVKDALKKAGITLEPFKGMFGGCFGFALKF